MPEDVGVGATARYVGCCVAAGAATGDFWASPSAIPTTPATPKMAITKKARRFLVDAVLLTRRDGGELDDRLVACWASPLPTSPSGRVPLELPEVPAIRVAVDTPHDVQNCVTGAGSRWPQLVQKFIRLPHVVSRAAPGRCARERRRLVSHTWIGLATSESLQHLGICSASMSRHQPYRNRCGWRW